jgi:hypothetical protein
MTVWMAVCVQAASGSPGPDCADVPEGSLPRGERLDQAAFRSRAIADDLRR